MSRIDFDSYSEKAWQVPQKNTHNGVLSLLRKFLLYRLKLHSKRTLLQVFSSSCSEAHSEPCQTYKMELLATIVNNSLHLDFSRVLNTPLLLTTGSFLSHISRRHLSAQS